MSGAATATVGQTMGLAGRADATAQGLYRALAQNFQATRELSLTLRAAMPQTWTWAMLAERWPGLHADQVHALIRDRVGYQGPPGKGVILSLEEVLACDEEIRARLAATRRKGGA